MEDSRVSECLSGAWSLALAVALVEMACTIHHGTTSQSKVEFGEDRKMLFRIGQNYSFMSTEMTTNTFLINEVKCCLRWNCLESWQRIPRNHSVPSYHKVQQSPLSMLSCPYRASRYRMVLEAPAFCETGRERCDGCIELHLASR